MYYSQYKCKNYAVVLHVILKYFYVFNFISHEWEFTNYIIFTNLSNTSTCHEINSLQYYVLRWCTREIPQENKRCVDMHSFK